MPFTLVLHIANTDPVVGEVEKLPSVTDNLIMLTNPRKMDGKDLHYLAESVVTVFWPIEKINFMEVLPGEEDEEIIAFYRE
jgi:hypothetical protein